MTGAPMAVLMCGGCYSPAVVESSGKFTQNHPLANEDESDQIRKRRDRDGISALIDLFNQIRG